MRAVGKNIVINVIEEEITTASGLLLSAEDSNQMRYKRGVVLSPGTEVQSVKEGEEIYYDKRQSFTMIVDGNQVTVITERDLVLVV